MEFLPPEILQLIFSYFPLEHQVLNFRPVCSSWAAAVDASPAWRTYNFDIDCSGDYDLFKLEKMPSLQILKVRKIDATASEALTSLQLKLRDLRIERIQDNLVASKIAGVMSSSIGSLEKLSLSSDIFINSECAKIIGQCDRLEELALFYPHFRRCDPALMIVADGVCPLKKFAFCRNMFSNSTLNYFFRKKGKDLTALNYIVDLDDEMEDNYTDFNWIKTNLSNKILSNLTELVFRDYTEEHNTLVRLIFDNCRFLVKFELDVSTLSDRNLKDIHKCTNLSVLKIFSAFEVTSVGLSYIANCNKLTMLYLDIPGRIDDNGINSLLKMKNLKSLKLPEAILPHDFYLQIASNMIHLRDLLVSTLCGSIRMEMQHTLPHLEIRATFDALQD